MKRLLFIFVVLSAVLMIGAEAWADDWRITVVGPGGDPQWSPSGERIAVWRRDTLNVYRTDSLQLIQSVIVEHPWSYCWADEERLAVFYKKETDEAKPFDRRMIAINSVLALQSGRLQSVTCDTLVDRSDYLTPWQRLPNGTVGVYRMQNGIRTRFFRLADNQLVEASPDTAVTSLCTQRFLPLRNRYEYFPSNDCSMALAYRAPDQTAVILDSTGEEILTLGNRFVPVEQGRFRCMNLPEWSVDARFLAFIETVENGEYMLSANLKLVDVSAGKVTQITSLKEGEVTSLVWSPVRAELAFTAPQLGGVLIYRQTTYK